MCLSYSDKSPSGTENIKFNVNYKFTVKHNYSIIEYGEKLLHSCWKYSFDSIIDINITKCFGEYNIECQLYFFCELI